MNETETNTETKGAGQDSTNGDNSQTVSPIEQANEAIERLKTENDRTEANLKKAEEIAATKILEGEADAGEGSKEETPKEYAQKALRNEL